MPYIETNISVCCTADKIYPVLKDMQQYPGFMSDLVSVEVLERNGDTTVTKWVSNVDGRIIKWTELDTFDDQNMHISYQQIDGDLKKMAGEWVLTSTAAGTDIKLTVDFEFGIPMISGLLNPILKKKVRENSMSMLQAIKEKMEASL